MSFDNLPTELLHVIAADSEPAYKALILAYPRFAREVTPGKRVDYMVYFGHDVKCDNISTIWYRNGAEHRLDGPAVTYICGNQWWYRNGVKHRNDGPAVIFADGDLFWHQNGKRHRDDGPAVIRKGFSEWYVRGKFIRKELS